MTRTQTKTKVRALLWALSHRRSTIVVHRLVVTATGDLRPERVDLRKLVR